MRDGSPDGRLAESLYRATSVYQMLFGDRSHDLPFYLEVAAACGDGARVLDYGVGTGRVALPLARAGHPVMGVDDAPAMLATLADLVAEEPPEVRAKLEWRLGCARDLRLGARFDLVICPFNGLAHHHHDDAIGAFLEAVRTHLAPEGRFAFDVLLPNPVTMEGTSSHIPWFRHPERQSVCRATEDIHYDPATELLTITTTMRDMEEERPDEVLQLVLRQHHPAALEALLSRHGFEVLSRSDDLGDVVGMVSRVRG
jgi:SAM-dependent methyltransferase